jgi:nucleoside transporter
MALHARLAVMMFIQYFSLGAWAVTLAKYLGKPAAQGGLGFDPPEIGGIYSTFAIGGLIAPLFTGLLADRFFASQRILAVLHLFMSVLLAGAAYWLDQHAGKATESHLVFWPLFAIMLGYNVCCLSSLTLTNVLSFRNLADPRASFGYIRLVGTFGWIVAGLAIAFGLNPISADPLYMGAVASLIMVAYTSLLPHTPPKGKGLPIADVLGLPAIKLLRDPVFVVFAIVLFTCNALNQFYGVYINPYLDDLQMWKPEAVLTLGQWCEMGCMAVAPLLVQRFGLKPVMVLGLVGWVLRNGMLYVGWTPLVLLVAIPMHGLSFAFFGMLGSIFVDREAPPKLRAGAQALVMLLTNGPALLLGNVVAGQIVLANRSIGASNWTTNWTNVWGYSTLGYIFAIVVFVLFFREPPPRRTAEPTEDPELVKSPSS